MILEGRGVVEVGGATAPVGPGDRVLIPAGSPQRITNTGGADLVFDESAPRGSSPRPTSTSNWFPDSARFG